ncbi:M67 family metallopeptidase [Paenibacillus sp. S-38]|uniref:M67 family metallopeptidase n=1 Tax=Paenibacillus sp. S-38 TaxID=3416710 RepID=UPI003CF5F183
MESIYREMVRYGLSLLPEEACGVLSGFRTSEGLWTVNRFDPVANLAPQPRITFEMDPSGLIPVLHAAEQQRQSIVGIVHTHPASAPIPSPRDLSTSWHTLPSHWILSLQNPSVPTAGVYRYFIDPTGTQRFEPLPFLIVPDTGGDSP